MSPSLIQRLAHARRAYAALESFARRRARFLEALDLDALAKDDSRMLEAETDRLMLTLAEAWLFVDHIEQQIAEAREDGEKHAVSIGPDIEQPQTTPADAER